MFIAPATDSPRSTQTTVDCLAACIELTKPRIVTMVIATAFTGFWAASAGSPDAGRLALAMAGVALLSAGAFTLNQYLERDLDRKMRRTQGRPLPAGRIEPADAKRLGWASAAAGLGILGSLNILSAAIGTATLVSYLWLYTPLKTRTPHSTLVGAFPGAAPPLLGWAAAQGQLSVEAWSLFAILLLWQFPHFHAIALVYREDYAAAGIRLWPVVDPGGTVVARQIACTTVALVAASIAPALLGMVGTIYAVGALVFGAALLALAVRASVRRTRRDAQRLLLGSVIYLPAVLGLLVWNQ